MTEDFAELENAREEYRKLEAKTRANLRAIEAREAREAQLLKRIVEQLQSIFQLIQAAPSDR